VQFGHSFDEGLDVHSAGKHPQSAHLISMIQWLAIQEYNRPARMSEAVIWKAKMKIDGKDYSSS